jgi:hypothetical protein
VWCALALGLNDGEEPSLEEIKASLLDAGYPDAEVNDMIEAMSELPQYADTTLQKGQ